MAPNILHPVPPPPGLEPTPDDIAGKGMNDLPGDIDPC